MSDETALTRPAGSLERASAAANDAAGRAALLRYRAGLAEQTRRAQDADLARWARYLAAAGVAGAACGWAEDVECWRGVAWGLVEAFISWQQAEGYAAASVARALSTVRSYAEQAARAGAISPEALALIQTVKAPKPGSKAARNRDAQREQTRIGEKKAEHTPLTRAQAAALKRQPNTPEGRRDALVMCLLLDHGLRVSEVYDLQVTDLDLAAGLLRFYRRKVHAEQTHKLTRATLAAARRYLAEDAPAAGRLVRATQMHTDQLAGPISIDGLRLLVRRLGQAAGVDKLSPHDCRHYWATQQAAAGVDPLRLQEAGGWSSLTMPRRYVERAAIANAGLVDPAEDEEE